MESKKGIKPKLSDSAGIKVAISIVIILVGINSIYIYSKLGDLENNKQRLADILEFRENLDMIFETVQKSDLGMRGFYINPDDGMLTPHLESVSDQKRSLEILLGLFEKYGLETDDLKSFMQEVKEYIELNSLLIDKIRQGDLNYVSATVKEDPGLELWLKYTKFSPGILAFLDNLNKESEAEYQNDVINTILVQILIIILGIPALLVILNKINSGVKQRKALFEEIDLSGREYVFDNQQIIDGSDEVGIIQNMKANLAEASRFVKEITDGNYDVNWSGMTQDLKPFNIENLAGNMIKMRDHMKVVKVKDDQHLWSVNGLAKFAEIVRDNMHNQEEFAGKIISNLVKYLDANQAAFFVVNEDLEILELKGCFAYDRKKFQSMSINKGQGLTGQCWLEKELMYLKQVPANYVRITSGLGEETPTSLIIAPVLAEDKVMGIIEIASFTEFEQYKIEFIHKLCTSIGSSLAMIKVNEQTNRLLWESKEMSERLRSQEEELLQNSEELQATQEELQRKLEETEIKLRAAEAAYGEIEINEDGKLATHYLN
jgi:putative methionine-R-sulfoxide reductase with GAF domain/CHASE3 domain sensor protein